MRKSSSGMIYNPYKSKRSGSSARNSTNDLAQPNTDRRKSDRLKQAQIIQQGSSRRSGSRPHTSRIQNSKKKSSSRPGSARGGSRSRASMKGNTRPRSKSKNRARGDSATKNKFFSSLNSFASSIFNKKVSSDVSRGGDGSNNLRKSDIGISKKFSNICKI